MQISRMLKSTRRILERCKTSAEIFEQNEELKQALLDVMVAIVLFWAEASRIMRDGNSGQKSIPLETIGSLLMD